MRVDTHVTLVVDNTAPQTQRSKCATPPQSFLTVQHQPKTRAWFLER